LHLAAPKTWDQFIAACETLKSNGITPVCQGNKAVWPIGNWAAHVASRVAGEAQYRDVMTLAPGARFENPDFIRAFRLFEDMAGQNYFNPGMSGRSDLEGMMVFLNGHSAMHPIGSWLINRAIDEQATLDYDVFNTPAIAEGKGDSTSIIGVTFGYLIGKQSRYADLAAEFLEYLTRPAVQQRFVAIGSLCSVRGVAESAPLDPHLKKMFRLIDHARTIVQPPDTGFKLDIADAFNDAAALVAGGQMTAVDALRQADRVVRRFRNEKK